MLKDIRKREEWSFFAALPRAHRGLAVAWWSFIAARGILPAAGAVSVGVLVGAVEHGDALTWPLTAVGTIFVVTQLLAPLHSQVSANLGDHLSSWLHGWLLAATTGPAGVAHLESPRLVDELTIARDFDLGMSGPPMTLAVGLIATGLVDMSAGFAQAVVLFAYQWWAPLLLGGAWGSTHWLMRKSATWDQDDVRVLEAQRHAEYNYRLAVAPSSARELRLFGLGEWLVDRFAENRRRLVDLRWRASRLRRGSLATTITVVAAANGLFFWSLAHDASRGALAPGAAIAFAQAAVGTVALAFGGLNWAVPPAAHSVAVAERLTTAMAEEGALASGDRLPDPRGAATVRFRNVGFHYPNSSRPVLDGLDLTVPAGRSLAVVGLNGAGKTTLVKLLCRLYDPTSGMVEVDGADLREMDLTAWRRQIAAVFQDYIRYEKSLRDNVAPLGAPDDLIEASLTESGGDGLSGLETVLARGYEDGVDLSGGQWQRVALARALAAVRGGARYVVLDEPTSQLDVRAEMEIFERLLKATRGCTTVLISHRFATVRHADLICVLEEGRVAELGSHEELMAAGGRYRTMFDLQAARFDPEERSGTRV